MGPIPASMVGAWYVSQDRFALIVIIVVVIVGGGGRFRLWTRVVATAFRAPVAARTCTNVYHHLSTQPSSVCAVAAG